MHLESDPVLLSEVTRNFNEQITDRSPFASDRQDGDFSCGHEPIVTGERTGLKGQATIVSAPGSASSVTSSKVPM